MTLKIKKKFVKQKDGSLLFNNTADCLKMEISQSDKQGLIWCDNCYKDDVPILSMTVKCPTTTLYLANLCEDCIKLFFSEYNM